VLPVSVVREGGRARQRQITTGGGGEAEIWLEHSNSSVMLKRTHRDVAGTGGSGTANWERCRASDCLGARLPGGDRCLLHADTAARSDYYDAVRSRRSSFVVSGVIMDEALWSEALGALRQDRTIPTAISCAGAVFPFRVSMDGLTFSESLSFTGSSFDGGVDIHSCAFDGGLLLDYVDFDDAPAVFRECTVKKALAGSFAHMDRDRQHVAFVSCQIATDVQLTGFSGELRFDDCEIQGSLDIVAGSLTHFSLDRLHLHGQLDARDLEVRTLRAQSAQFDAASIIGPFSAEAIDFAHAVFGARTQLIFTAKRASLRHATWQRGGRLEVEDAQVDFNGVVLAAPVALIGKGSAALQSIRDADAGLLSISMMDLSRCTFREAHRLQEMSVDSTVTLPLAPRLRARRRCVADEFAWRARHARGRREDWRIEGMALGPTNDPEIVVFPDVSAAQVEGVYRSLRKALESGANEPGASDFYYGEMELRRVDKRTNWAERLIITIYWLSSGYGLRASRALAWLFLVVLGGAIALREVGFRSPSTAFHRAWLSAWESAIPGIGRTDQLTGWGRAINLVLAVFGPVFLALAALALRNRVKR
jgi:hypothetical protein